jgi:hypothetical protein
MYAAELQYDIDQSQLVTPVTDRAEAYKPVNVNEWNLHIYGTVFVTGFLTNLREQKL